MAIHIGEMDKCISNEDSRTDADRAEEYMNKLLDEGRLVVME